MTPGAAQMKPSESCRSVFDQWLRFLFLDLTKHLFCPTISLNQVGSLAFWRFSLDRFA